MIEQTLRAAGLYTDPSELSDVPDGALLEAKNVRIRRAGVIEPRPRFPAVSGAFDAWGAVASKVCQLFSWAGEIFGVVVRDSDSATALERSGSSNITDETDSSDIAFNCPQAYADAAQRNLYMSATDRVYRLAGPTETTAAWAGTPPQMRPVGFGGDTADGNLPASASWAWRVTFSRTVNGQLLEGAPSVPLVSGNGGGTVLYTQNLRIVLPPGVTSEHILRVYRTDYVTFGDAPGDELFLVDEQAVTSSDVTNGYVDYSDTGKSLGTTPLYTNETQEGIAQAAYPPPPTNDLRWFQEMMFYGGVNDGGRASKSFTVDGPCFVQFWGTVTSGSPTITGVTATAASFLEVGMEVEAGENFPAGTKVQSINTGAGTVTMDANATGNDTDVKVRVRFDLDGTDLDATEGWIPAAWGVFDTVWGAQNLLGLERAVTANLSGSVVYVTNARTDTVQVATDHLVYIPRADITIEAPEGFTIHNPEGFTAFKGLETSAETINGDPAPNRLMFSKLDQPDAVPLLNFVDIGSKRDAILRIASTRDSLFVFKPDGVWRVTGRTPETLAVDEFDQTLRLIHPRALVELDNMIYAWTSEGVVRLGEQGVEHLSDVAIENELDGVQRAVLTAAQFPEGVFMASHQSDDMMLLGVPDAALANDYAEWLYVFESKTRAWCRWQIDATVATQLCAVFDRSTDLLNLGGQGVDTYPDLREQDDDAVSDAASVAVTITAINGNVVSVTHPSGSAPALGAQIAQGAVTAFAVEAPTVLTATTATVVVDDASGLTAAAATMHYGLAVDVQWAAKTAGMPGLTKLYRDFSLLFGSWGANTRVRCKFQTDLVATEGEITHATTAETNRVRDLRGCVTRAHMRASRIRPRVLLDQAAQDWALDGVTLAFEQQRGGERQV